jgi:opacity protein-like surface antigen
MKIRHSLFVVLALAATPAFAFDMPPPVEAPEYTGTIADANGWYIRGDLGYNAAIDMGKPSFRNYEKSTDSYESMKFDSARLDGNFNLAAGAGYQFSDYLRSDLTLDYFKADFEGQSTKNSRCSAAQLSSTKCSYSHTDSMAALGLLANAYVDLGTVWGFTPYLGAGAGMTNVDWKGMTTSKRCSGENCNNRMRYDDEFSEGIESWRFTYALMAGVSYDVAPHTKLDFGYRYAQIGAGDMTDFSEADQQNGAKNPKGKDKGFGRHEFRAGLRLTTW